MKTLTLLSVSLLTGGFAAWTGVARADTTDANCEVRKEGETQKGRSGPCTFSQRQGYIDIDLRNGDTISLRPANNAGHYKDQNGAKVSRAESGTNGMTLKWEGGKRIIISWRGGNQYGNSTYGSGGNHSAEYKRGYNDGLRGNWDQGSHNQDYKDGYRAAEGSVGNGNNNNDYNNGQHSGQGDYGINQLGNGQYEVVWSKPFCSVTIDRNGNISRTTEDCTNHQIDRSREVGRRGH